MRPTNEREQTVLSSERLGQAFQAHLAIVTQALLVALALGVPLGVLLARRLRWLRSAVFTVANLSQAIPSVSFLAGAFFVLGIGQTPAVVALSALSLLPILRNTVVGLQGVDPAVIEAARGMGMSGPQSFFRVELPLAAPAIFAGVRTAVVLNISSATLATFIGGGGLGDIIQSGIDANLGRATLVGAVLVACVALTADWLAGLVEQRLSPDR